MSIELSEARQAKSSLATMTEDNQKGSRVLPFGLTPARIATIRGECSDATKLAAFNVVVALFEGYLVDVTAAAQVAAAELDTYIGENDNSA